MEEWEAEGVVLRAEHVMARNRLVRHRTELVALIAGVDLAKHRMREWQAWELAAYEEARPGGSRRWVRCWRVIRLIFCRKW